MDLEFSVEGGRQISVRGDFDFAKKFFENVSEMNACKFCIARCITRIHFVVCRLNRKS